MTNNATPGDIAQNFYDLREAIATDYFTYSEKTKERISKLSDEELAAYLTLAQKDPDRESDFIKIEGKLAMELVWRHSLKRMKELDCDSYCPHHDCDTKNCPVGEHGE